jgi:hypothetical protein
VVEGCAGRGKEALGKTEGFNVESPVGAQATFSKEKIPPPEPPLRIVHTDMETGRVKQVYHIFSFENVA